MSTTRESRYVRAARIAYLVSSQNLPQYIHPHSPRYFTFPQLSACVVLMIYIRLSYRDMEEFLLASESVRRTLELDRVPNYSTLSRVHHRLYGVMLATLVADFTALLNHEESGRSDGLGIDTI